MIHSYLRTHRKRCGLTQDEVAFLLGCRTGTKVSRFERLARKPNLATALACKVVFGIPAHELFPRAHAEVEKEVAERARALANRLRTGSGRDTGARWHRLQPRMLPPGRAPGRGSAPARPVASSHRPWSALNTHEARAKRVFLPVATAHTTGARPTMCRCRIVSASLAPKRVLPPKRTTRRSCTSSLIMPSAGLCRVVAPAL